MKTLTSDALQKLMDAGTVIEQDAFGPKVVLLAETPFLPYDPIVDCLANDPTANCDASASVVVWHLAAPDGADHDRRTGRALRLTAAAFGINLRKNQIMKRQKRF